MNISFLIWARESFGGAERRYSRLAQELAKKNNVSIFASNQSRHEFLALGCENLVIYTDEWVPERLRRIKVVRIISLLLTLLRFARQRNAFLFVVANPGYVTFLFSVFKPASVCAGLGGFDLVYGRYLSSIEKKLARFSVKRVHFIDVLSENVLRRMENELVLSLAGRAKIAPCSFTDLSRVVNSASRDIDVVLMSRFIEYKGHELIEEVKNDLTDLEVHICGSGSRLIDIPFAKIYRATDPFYVYSRSKIALSLQRFGNYPSQALIEAMASGCAIIATDTGETRQLLDDSCAILIPYDSQHLKIAIRSLIVDEELRLRLGAAAMNRVIHTQTVQRYSSYFYDSVATATVRNKSCNSLSG